jgi:DNA-binding transcriptional MocR family regulator
MATIDLQMNYPILSGQKEQLERHFREAMASGGKWMEGPPYGGYPEHREAAAEWLSRDGVRTHCSRVMIAAGGHSGVMAALIVAGLIGKKIATDSLTYPGFKLQASQMNCELIGCAGDEHGMKPEELERAASDKGVTAVYLMPTVHNPMGIVMPVERRQELCAVAKRHNLIVIDDDAYGFCEAKPPANFSELAPERSYFVHSFTKPYAPAMKLAFIVFPEERAAAMTNALRSLSSGAPALFAEVAARMIRSGEMEKLLAAKREEAVVRQKIAADAFKGLNTTAHPTSFHVWIDLPKTIPAGPFAAQLKAEGIVVSPSSASAVGETNANGIRVALGAIRDLNELKTGVLRLRSAIDQASR